MYYTDDPIADFNAWDAEREEREERRPICGCCKQYIYDEYFYIINGGILCKSCLDDGCAYSTDEYMEE